jgi:anthranilate phosphoribosyltransferase
MQLKFLLGLRSPVNTLSRQLNPLRTPASLQSIFHPAYATLHQASDRLLGQPRAIVFKGESGEIEVKPQADTRLSILEGGAFSETVFVRTMHQRVASVTQPSVEPLRALWRGDSFDEYGLEATIMTTATALLCLTPEFNLESARQGAQQLWRDRDPSRLG